LKTLPGERKEEKNQDGNDADMHAPLENQENGPECGSVEMKAGQSHGQDENEDPQGTPELSHAGGSHFFDDFFPRLFPRRIQERCGI
jgi:hypothetical protein